MKFSAMLGDVLTSLVKKPFTEKYPFEKKPAPARLRGKLVWDTSKCVGCQLCANDCPSDAIEFIVLDKATRRYVLRYHADRCTYCAQCVVNCRFKCLKMSNEEWELASTDRDTFTIYYGRPEDVSAYLYKDRTGSHYTSSED